LISVRNHWEIAAVLIALNGTSKVFAFAASVTLFLPETEGAG
jgi:hypothetical protein